MPLQERHSPIAVAIAWPFILVRLIYSALAVFVNNDTFSVVGGKVSVRAAMAVIEEFLVVFDYLILGLMLHKLQPEEQGELANRAWKDRRGKRRGNSRENRRGNSRENRGGNSRRNSRENSRESRRENRG